MSKGILRVLIVEDNEDDFELLLMELKKSKYEISYELVDNAKSFKSALKKKWDVIISDYSLPAFNGYEALKICNQSGQDIPFIIVSGTVGEDLAVEMMRAGAKDYLMKKSLKLLLPAIEREIFDAKVRKKNKLIALEREVLFTIGKDLVTSESLDDFFVKIHANIKKILYAENCFIALYDSKKDEISFPFFIDKFDIKPEPTKKRKGLTEYVLQKGKPLISNPEIFKKIAKEERLEEIGTVAQSWLGVPLIVQSKAIGVLVVQSYEKEIKYNENDMKFLEAIATDIAVAIERKQSENVIKESEEKYRTLVEKSSDQIFMISREYKILSMNISTLKILGKTEDDVKGKYISDVLPESISGIMMNNIGKVFETGSIVKAEEQIELNEQQFWTSTQLNPIFDNNEKVIAVIGILRDITELKKSEVALKESEERFKQVTENAGDWIWEVNEKGLYTYSSPVVEKLLGYKPEEIVGKKHFYDLFIKEGREEIKKAAFDVFGKKEAIKNLVNINLHKNGSLVIIETNGVPILDENGDLIGYRGADTNITERKKSEEALRESEERYRVFINSTSDMAFLKDNEFKYIIVNEANAKFFKKDISEIVGKTDFEILPESFAKRCQKSDELALVSESVVINEEHIEDKIYETHKFRVPLTNKGFGIGGYIRDITERKWAEENLRKSEEHYRTLLTAIPDLMFRLNKEGRFIDYHVEDTTILFAPPEKFLGKHFSEILPDNVAKKFRKVIDDVMKTGDLRKFEYELLLPDNKMHSYEARITCYEGESVAIIRDVTEQKNAEKSLVESEERYRKIFEESPYGIVLVDKKLKFIKVNSEFCRITGYSEKELLGKTFKDITHKDHIEKDIENVKMLMNGEISIYNTEKRYIRKEGIAIWCEINVSVVKNLTGEFMYLLAMVEDISARKQAEEAVKESEEHFRNIVNTAEAAYFRINSNGLYDDVNHAWLKMHKYSSADEIIGKHFVVTQTENDSEKAKNIVNELLKGKPIATGEFSRKCKDGSVGYHTFSVNPVIEKGVIVGIEGFLIDITEQKKTLEALKTSQERYRILIETMNEGVILVDIRDEIQFINRSACDIFGYEPEELIGKISYETIIADEDRNIIIEKNLLRLASVSDSYEIRGLKKSGEVIWLNVNGAPVKDKTGEIVGSVGIMIDITAKKHAEEELKKLSRAVEQSPASIIITDINGTIEYVNPKFVSITGYMPEEVIGSNPRILKSGKTPKNEYVDLWRSILTGKDWIGEFQNKKKNGELYWESAFISPVKNTDGKITHFLAIKEDITEKKQKEIELIHAKEKAEESERLKSSFLANMSHELRTPMVGILGFAELMKDMADNPELKDFSENIIKSGKRLLETLNLILDLSRIEAGRIDIKSSEVDIVQIVREVYENYIIEAERKNLQIHFKTSEEQIICKLDERMLWESVSNLINNAIKYTKAGEVKVTVQTNKNKSIAFIKIKDTGIGIPDESLNTIFEEFRQVSEGYSRGFEGTGLGLTITKNFIEKNGGKIKVESEIGLGSLFTIELPILSVNSEKKQEIVVEKKDTREKDLIEKKDIKVLCVDDDSFTREYLEYILKDYYQIAFADNGFTAIEMTKSDKYSAILMDINLGKGIDGIETSRKIKKLPGYENIPVIAMTAFAMKGDKEEFLNSGMHDYISKPFKSEQLVEIINRALEVKEKK